MIPIKLPPAGAYLKFAVLNKRVNNDAVGRHPEEKPSFFHYLGDQY